jgi:hypothetical protein
MVTAGSGWGQSSKAMIAIKALPMTASISAATRWAVIFRRRSIVMHVIVSTANVVLA